MSQPEDHAAGLATFTVMAGLGGSVGYMLGGVIDWKTTGLGSSLGGHVQVGFCCFTAATLIGLCLFHEKC